MYGAGFNDTFLERFSTHIYYTLNAMY